jgi:hypothetical protein
VILFHREKSLFIALHFQQVLKNKSDKVSDMKGIHRILEQNEIDEYVEASIKDSRDEVKRDEVMCECERFIYVFKQNLFRTLVRATLVLAKQKWLQKWQLNNFCQRVCLEVAVAIK